jgi:hypothetical protein
MNEVRRRLSAGLSVLGLGFGLIFLFPLFDHGLEVLIHPREMDHPWNFSYLLISILSFVAARYLQAGRKDV